MAFFCENCGTKLPADAAFCENCGAAVARDEQIENTEPAVTCTNKVDVDLFADKGWAKSWEKLLLEKGGCEVGIILTNTSGCPDGLKGAYLEAVKKYSEARRDEGVIYCCLDLGCQTVKSAFFGKSQVTLDFALSVLKKVYEVGMPDHLMIVGDREAVPSAKWENGLYDGGRGDSDKYVDSDVPYITLEAKSLFEGAPFSPKVGVGRIPSSAKGGFQEALTYFENAENLSMRAKKINAITLSAYEWKRVSQMNFDDIDPDFYTCPSSSFVERSELDIIDKRRPYNLLSFNLHGSDRHDYWVSGDGNAAYSPDCLPTSANVGYVIGTESCYGAKPVIRDSGEAQSTLVSALGDKCLAFFGSTQIAYGIPDTALAGGSKPCCADILVGEFVNRVSDGWEFGKAYLSGLSALISSVSGRCTAEDVKTMCSFALYGDPSLTLTAPVGSKKTAKSAPAVKSDTKSLHITMPDVRAIVGKKIAAVSKEIEDRLKAYVSRVYEGFEGVTPTYYKIGNKGEYKASYFSEARSEDQISTIMNLYFDEDGTVGNVYVSK